MAEIRPLRPIHPLTPWEPALAGLNAELGAAGLSIEIQDFGLATTLRMDPDGPAADVVSAVLGARVPTRPNTWTATDDGEIVWLGPDEWLVTSRRGSAHVGERSLQALVAGPGGSAVDVSGQRVALRVRGRLARELLAFGCALDLHPSKFPAGRSAQTTIALAGVVLVGFGHGDDYLIHVRPSFAGHLADWLLDAAQEFRLAPTGSA